MLKPGKNPNLPFKAAPFLFKPIHMPPPPPSTTHLIKLLKLSADTKNLRAGKTIHAHLITTNQATRYHKIEANSLVNLYAKCNQILTARKLFDNMPDRNVVSWSALMTGYFHNGFSSHVIELLREMVLEGVVIPNKYIFAMALSSCSDGGRVAEGRQCHGYVLKSGLVFYEYVRNALVTMYFNYLNGLEAMLVWDSVPGNDIISYNSILSGMVEHGYLREGLEVLRKMVDEGLKWDGITYVSVFGLCTCLKDLKLGFQVHCKMLMSGVEGDAYVSSALINMYGKCGRLVNTKKVFERLQSRNVVLWTALMTAYLQNGCFEEALNLLSNMGLEGVKPNEFSFALLLNASAGLSTLRCGSLLHASTEKLGFKDHIMVANALINMYAKGGNIEAAKTVFSGMVHRDTITWNAMICGYSHHGLGKKALLVFNDMLVAEEQPKPNYVTFVGVLSACGHVGLVQEGFYYFDHLMNQIGIERGLEHYTCIVGLLSKAGQLDEAHKFMRSAPVEWDVVAWRTLLNACCVHQSYGLGKRVSELILEMDPNDVGTFSLLSNMFAKTKRWDGVANIRRLMREKRIKKEPGVSWIEIGNMTHIFVSEDNKHPEHAQIHEKVQELLAMIKPLGYVPDVGVAAHDVEDEQKGDHLSYHSEKLAIAYGLMKTPPGESIIVIKNIRICDDCHSAVKLISKVTNRMIIVRDSNRFHHFQDGCCSCADYW